MTFTFRVLSSWSLRNFRWKVHLRDTSQTVQTKTAFQNMMNFLCSKSLLIKVRKNVLWCYIEPFLLYGSETWTIDTKAKKHIETK
jgi:hypothetical protein